MFQQFFNSEKAGGLILIACTVVSLSVANSSLGDRFYSFLAYWPAPSYR